jgi:hypothetical protein
MAPDPPPARANLQVGDTFAVPLADGRYGACRVLRVHGPGPGAPDRQDVLLAALAWVGTEPPPLTEPRLRLLLRTTCHGQDGRPRVSWFSQAEVPDSARFLGVLAPAPGETALRVWRYDSWKQFTAEVLLQWRWDEEHGIPLAEDEADLRRRERAASRAYAARRRGEVVARLTAADLLAGEGDLFAGCEEEDEGVEAARSIIRDTVAALLALGPEDEVARLDALHGFIKRFNEDEVAQEALFRPGICNVFADLVWLAGLEDYGAALSDPPWRDF